MKPETLAEAIAWDARRDAYVASGLSAREAARRAWTEPEETPDTSENANLLKMLKQDGDAKIAKDLDCYPCGACRRPTCFVCEYAKARRKATGFSAKNYLTNNHRKIPELTMHRIRALAEPPKRRRKGQCEAAGCSRTVVSKRSDARFCSPRCRQIASRAA